MFEFFLPRHGWREVWTDGRRFPRPMIWSRLGTATPSAIGTATRLSSTRSGLTIEPGSTNLDIRHSDQMKLQERYRRLDRDTLELTMTLTDPEYYSKPWVSDTKIFKTDAACISHRATCIAGAADITEFPQGESKLKNWDEQNYCAPSEEYKFNERVRNPAGGSPSNQ